MSKIAAVILAAGEGKRMNSSHSKVIHKVCGKPMVSWVLKACTDAGAETSITIVGHKQEEVRAVLGDCVSYAVQSELLGTGHAVMQAIPFLHNCDHVVILSGDAPLITSKTISNALAYHLENKNAATVFTATLDNPYGYGRIVRDESGKVIKITEQKDASPEVLLINEVNGGMYFFETAKLIDALSKIDNNNAQKEYYLTDTLEVLRNEGENIGAFIIDDPNEIQGANDKVQLCFLDKLLRKRINEGHARGGAYLWDLENTYIGPDVIIEKDSEILPGCILEGNTKILSGAVVGPNTHLINTVVGQNTEISNSVAVDSEIGANAHIGPFAYLRPNSVIGNNCKVGDFVEIKNSSLGDGTKASHLTYVGDSIVGKNVNFGCGTITVNYDGKQKTKTTIGDNAFIGCNSNLISPVSVGDHAYIAAGSTITNDVPQNTLAIARARQVIKESWKDKRD